MNRQRNPFSEFCILLALFALLLTVVVAMNGCSTVSPVPASPEPVLPQPSPLDPAKQAIPSARCKLVSETLALANQTVTLPRSGRFTLESHLATTEDFFPGGAFPSTQIEGIPAHLTRALKYLPAIASSAEVYPDIYRKEWTPEEGGLFGQGSVGNRKPTPEQEAWSGNFFWTSATKPKIGVNDKFLFCNGARCVVANVGFETGPRDKAFLGGLQGEVFWSLHATDQTQVQAARLSDQTIPLGPIDCGGAP